MTHPIEINGLVKDYGTRRVLNELSLQIHAGEIVGLLGVNGAGKSTLIKCLLDLIEADAGEIKLFGISHRQTAARRKLSYLSEQFRPPYYARGHDVLKLMAGLEGLEFSASDISEYCRLLALDEAVLAHPCQSYSKGMRQKLGLISCLLAEKPLLILDEPMSGLDPQARKLFKDRLLAHRDKQRTIFFSTHLLEDIESICDRVVVLDDGRLRFIGTVPELLESSGKSSLEAAFLAQLDGSRHAA